MSTEERSVNQPEEQPSLSEQRLIRRAKLKELQDAGQDPFQITKFVVKHHSADIKEGFEALEGAMTSVAGRIMSKRGMGKAVFCDLQDGKGRIQLYVRVDELGEEAFAKFKKTDIGDIVGVEGEVFKTKRGEISSLQVPPASAREIPRPDRQGDALPPALCGSDHERGRAPCLPYPHRLHQAYAPVSGRAGLPGGGDPCPQHHLRRRHRPALHHPPQHPGHRHVYAHRHRAEPEAAHCGRL